MLHRNLLLTVNDLPLKPDDLECGVKKKPQRTRQPANSRETIEPDSNNSEDEEGYACNPRPLPLYDRRSVRLRPSHSEPHSELRAVAPEFQPTTQGPESDEAQQEEESSPLMMLERVKTPTQTELLPSVQVQGQLKDVVDEEPDMEAAPALEPVDEREQPLRRSTRVVKPRGMFTYNQSGQPTYQPWRMGAHAMYAGVPYPMPTCPVLPQTCYHPTPAVWTY